MSVLSDDQKRNLQLTIGLVGGSRIVLVDEYTSSVDLSSRRALWRTLMSVHLDQINLPLDSLSLPSALSSQSQASYHLKSKDSIVLKVFQLLDKEHNALHVASCDVLSAIALIGNPSIVLITEFSMGTHAKMNRDM
ncbi:uncharacterized protein F5147DRAFT_780690 [Suillus discolor]|uniref:ABC transporter domain-containing protein n=1 Tax=Suillus discolor TaxID=1912936 RepID=A0A9P7JM22_9AGAM|nr:uncharacterized protein F5147DRAFT_780690 [Suillus discolor]KAG2089227.1 hypothetical protein F5147DRAFT_780690 [Suillus discolor]